MRIAIVGSGIAGRTCAHVLGPHHDVVVFEASDRLGGHSNTVQVDDPTAGPLGVDTGFIVHNDRNYPNLVRLFDELGVEVADTEMSFGVTDSDASSPTNGFTYRATNLDTLFADRANVVRPTMWRMLLDIARFYRAANKILANADLGAEHEPTDRRTIGEFIADGGYGREFVDLHLIPMGAAVWSAEPEAFADFPAVSLLRFFKNHGLLGVGRRPQWRTVVGGSRRYVEALIERFDGDVFTGHPVERVTRLEASSDSGPAGQAVELLVAGRSERFDAVVMACHSDQALALISDATPIEKDVLGAIRYQPNRATLHTDVSLMSPNRKAWAAWNYDRRGDGGTAATLTYDMTALQGLAGSERYLVSLNSEHVIAPDAVLASFDYAHPIFDDAAIAAQARFDEVSGTNGLYFCGAYWRYGFHEDGMASGLRVCEQLGVRW